MSKFVYLTELTGGKVLINVDQIHSVRPIDRDDPKSGCEVIVGYGHVDVVETMRTMKGRLAKITGSPITVSRPNNTNDDTDDKPNNGITHSHPFPNMTTTHGESN